MAPYHTDLTFSIISCTLTFATITYSRLMGAPTRLDSVLIFLASRMSKTSFLSIFMNHSFSPALFLLSLRLLCRKFGSLSSEPVVLLFSLDTVSIDELTRSNSFTFRYICIYAHTYTHIHIDTLTYSCSYISGYIYIYIFINFCT